MSVSLSVCPSVIRTPQQLEIIILHNSTFIFHHSHSSCIHPSSFFIHPSFILRLLSFSACVLGYPVDYNLKIKCLMLCKFLKQWKMEIVCLCGLIVYLTWFLTWLVSWPYCLLNWLSNWSDFLFNFPSLQMQFRGGGGLSDGSMFAPWRKWIQGATNK